MAASHWAAGVSLTGCLDSDVVFMWGHYSSWGELINVSVVRSMPLSLMVIWETMVEQGGVWAGAIIGTVLSKTHKEYESVADPQVYCLGQYIVVLIISSSTSSMGAFKRYIIVFVRRLVCSKARAVLMVRELGSGCNAVSCHLNEAYRVGYWVLNRLLMTSPELEK